MGGCLAIKISNLKMLFAILENALNRYNPIECYLRKHNGKVVTMACRKNAKKEKARRNYIAARRIAGKKVRKFIPKLRAVKTFTDKELYFKYTANEAALNAAKIITKT